MDFTSAARYRKRAPSRKDSDRKGKTASPQLAGNSQAAPLVNLTGLRHR
jgi:hypothetical protein